MMLRMILINGRGYKQKIKIYWWRFRTSKISHATAWNVSSGPWDEHPRKALTSLPGALLHVIKVSWVSMGGFMPLVVD